jgi:DNA-directed RNA polymerase sigma subunit (sigma70/sigma32)
MERFLFISKQALAEYLRSIEGVQSLGAESLETAFVSYRDGKAAEKAIIESHLHLVQEIAAGYRECDVHLLDLLQEGNIGLMQAVTRFENGAESFDAFASERIRGRIEQVIKDSGPLTSLEALPYDPDKALTEYLETLKGVNRLRTEDLGHAFETYRSGKRAEKQIIESHLHLAPRSAEDYVGSGLPMLDLIQGGNWGLIQAMNAYAEGTELFSDLAQMYVREGIEQTIRDAKQENPAGEASLFHRRSNRHGGSKK